MDSPAVGLAPGAKAGFAADGESLGEELEGRGRVRGAIGPAAGDLAGIDDGLSELTGRLALSAPPGPSPRDVPSMAMLAPQWRHTIRTLLPRTFASGTAYLAGQLLHETFMESNASRLDAIPGGWALPARAVIPL